jgi:predicted Rossmann fold nucleotide-binding protein DprA/Smf involved in DNA uptake
MGRNKLIYAMADYGVVVSAEYKKGGTWTGAEEELKRENSRTIFVRLGNNAPPGNSKLLDLGATPWPDSIDRNGFRHQLHDLATKSNVNRPKKNLSLFDFQITQEAAPAEELPPVIELVDDKPTVAEPEVNHQECPPSVYQAVLPVILNKLNSPATAEELAETLDVNKTQLNAWLKKAVDENKIEKLSHPVRYKKKNSESASDVG